MPNIEVDNEVWAYLQSKSIPFQDRAPNDVLRREFGLAGRDENGRDPSQTHSGADSRATVHSRSAHASTRQSLFEALKPDRDYTYHPVTGYTLEGRHFAARSFKDVLLSVMNGLRGKHGHEFDRIATTLRGRKRVYFSHNERELKYPHPLAGDGLFVETNLNANLIVGICRTLLEKLGHDTSTLQIE
jgi:negative regulator of replication initiation